MKLTRHLIATLALASFAFAMAQAPKEAKVAKGEKPCAVECKDKKCQGDCAKECTKACAKECAKDCAKACKTEAKACKAEAKGCKTDAKGCAHSKAEKK